MVVSKNEIPEIIEKIPNFKERAVEASKKFQKDEWCFAYNVTDNCFCNRQVSWEDYNTKRYFGIEVYDNEEDGIVIVVNELFEDYMPLMPKGFGGIEYEM